MSQFPQKIDVFPHHVHLFVKVSFHSYIVVVPLTPEQKEERWQEMSADLSSFLQNENGGLPAIVNPFDPVSDVPEEDQK